MKRIKLNYKPLDKSVSLRIVSGSTMQQYNATTGEYVPDHTLVPLVIQPDVYISDPDGVISSGLKNSMLTDIAWYENSADSGNPLTTNSSYAIDTGNSDTRGRITVKKNIPEGEQLTLVFTASFLDTRTGYGVPVSGSILLGVSQAVEDSAPRLVSAYPAGSRLYPTTGQKGLKISCKLMGADDELPAAFAWEGFVSGSWATLSETDGYKGVDTGTLWIPKKRLSKQSKFRCTASFKGDEYTAEHVLGIAYEDYRAEIIVPGDGEVSPESSSVLVRAEIKNNAGTVQNPSEYFLIEWFDQDGEKLGEGETLTVQKSRYASGDFLLDLKVSEIYGETAESEEGIWVLNGEIRTNKSISSFSLGAVFTIYGYGAAIFETNVNGTVYLYGVYGNNIYKCSKDSDGVWSNVTLQADISLFKEDEENIINVGIGGLVINGTNIPYPEATNENPSMSLGAEEGETIITGANLIGINLGLLVATLTFEDYNLVAKSTNAENTCTFVPSQDGKTAQDIIEHITN